MNTTIRLQRFAQEGNAPQEPSQEGGKLSFDDLLKSDPQYKAAYDAKVRKAVESRFRQNKSQKESGDRAVYDRAMAQAKALGISLAREMRNPTFGKLVAQGTPVAAAYELAHRRELLLGAMGYAIRRTGQGLSDALRSGSLRPRENAMSPNQSPTPAPDPRSLTPAQRQEMRQRVARGEKVYW